MCVVGVVYAKVCLRSSVGSRGGKRPEILFFAPLLFAIPFLILYRVVFSSPPPSDRFFLFYSPLSSAIYPGIDGRIPKNMRKFELLLLNIFFMLMDKEGLTIPIGNNCWYSSITSTLYNFNTRTKIYGSG